MSDQPHKEKLLAAIHKEKILAAIENPKAKEDIDLLKEALIAYQNWIDKMHALKTKGHERIHEMTGLLNEYKDYLEVDLIAAKGSAFLKFTRKNPLSLSISKEKLLIIACPSVSGPIA